MEREEEKEESEKCTENEAVRKRYMNMRLASQALEQEDKTQLTKVL